MIQLPRSFFRQLRTVLRKALGRVASPVVIQPNPDDLLVRCHQDDIGIIYQTKEGQGRETLVLPAQALVDIEGKGQDFVTLERKGGKVPARWLNAGVPRVMEYDSPDVSRLPAFSERPSRMTPQEGSFLKALDDAMQSASQDTVRFALNKIQVRGGSGTIVATDGHQLLVQNGFRFTFTDDFLIPRTNVFGCKELQGQVQIAKTKTHFCVHADPWTIFLQIDTQSRFPRVESIIPTIGANATMIRLTPSDAAFLAHALPRLPSHADGHAPVTLDLSGEVIVRARGEGQEQSTEVVLAGSGTRGAPTRYALEGKHLAHAIDLGFTEGHVINPDSPMLFQDERRKLVIQTLGKAHILASLPNDLRLRSDASESSSNPPAQRRNEMRTPRVQPTAHAPPAETISEPNGHANGVSHDLAHGNGTSNGQQPKAGFNALLEEAQSIQNGLRDLLLRTNQLLVGLKAYRRHAKTMQSTLASLRQLQQVEA